MPTNERIRCHLLQLEGLASWPDDEAKQAMAKWVMMKIQELAKLKKEGK